MKAWLRKQWRDSLAYDIWRDMTPFGRATIWIPLWAFCWAALIVMTPIAYLFFLLDQWVVAPVQRGLHKVFFNA